MTSNSKEETSTKRATTSTTLTTFWNKPWNINDTKRQIYKTHANRFRQPTRGKQQEIKERDKQKQYGTSLHQNQLVLIQQQIATLTQILVILQ